MGMAQQVDEVSQLQENALKRPTCIGKTANAIKTGSVLYFLGLWLLDVWGIQWLKKFSVWIIPLISGYGQSEKLKPFCILLAGVAVRHNQITPLSK